MVGLVLLAIASVLFGDALAEDSDTCALLQQEKGFADNSDDAAVNMVPKKKEDAGKEWCSGTKQVHADYMKLCSRALEEENCMSIGFFCSWFYESFNDTVVRKERLQNIGKRAIEFKELGCSSSENVENDEVCGKASDEENCASMGQDCQWYYTATVVTRGVKTARGLARVKEWCSSEGEEERKTCGRAMSEEKCAEQDCVWNTAKALRRTKAKKEKSGSEEWCSSENEDFASLCGSARGEENCMKTGQYCNWYYKTFTGTVVKKQRWDAAKTKKD